MSGAGAGVGVRPVPVGRLSGRERERWLELRAAEPTYASPFLHPAFAEAVARSRDGVEVAVLERAGAPVGFLAFQRRGSGRSAEPAGGTMADVQAAVVERDLSWDVAGALEACGLDLLEYDHMLADRPELRDHHAYEDDAPTIDLSGGFDAFRRTVEATGTSIFRQLERKARKLEREVGPLRFELRAEGSDALATLIDWKRRRVRDQGFADPLGDPRIERLVGEVRRAREPGFEGLLSVLWAGGEPVAAHLGVLGESVLASWIPAFDSRFGRYSPGSILHLEMCREAAAAGIARVDLGRGENRLKERLSTGAFRLAVGAVERRPVHRAIRAGRTRLRAAVLSGPLGEPLRRGLRRVRTMRARAGR